MSEASLGYKLADSIHTSFFGSDSNLTQEERWHSGVQADIAGPYKTQRLTISGEIDGKQVYQGLTKSQRSGDFYLSTVFTEPGGKVLLTRISEEAPLETVAVLEKTLFIKALQRIVEARQ